MNKYLGSPNSGYFNFNITQKDETPETLNLIKRINMIRYQTMPIFDSSIHSESPIQKIIIAKNIIGLKNDFT